MKLKLGRALDYRSVMIRAEKLCVDNSATPGESTRYLENQVAHYQNEYKRELERRARYA